MRKRIFGLLAVLALCLVLLPGTAEAAETRTAQLKLTNQDAENTEEGWSWKKDDEDGYYYTLTLNNVNFEVPNDSAITFSMDKQIWLGAINIVLIGENRVVSTCEADNFYETYGIRLDSSESRSPGEIVVSGGGSLTAEGYRCGIGLGTDKLHFKGVTVNAQSAYPSGLRVTNGGSLLIEDSTVSANTISATGLTSSNSDISVVLSSVPAAWTYSDSLIAADSVDISGGTLTLSGSEERQAYCGISNNRQTSIDLSNCQIDIRNVQYGLHVNAGTINLTNVSGAVFCTESGALLTGQNPAFHANQVNASDCSIYAQTGSDILTYGDCSLPSEITEITIPGDLKIETGKTFTIGAGQKITFSKDGAQVCQYLDNTTLINSGTLEFIHQPTFRSGTKLVNNGILIAPEGISYSEEPGVAQNAQVTNNGTFNGIVTENSGFTQYIYGNVTLGGNRVLGVLNGSRWMINKIFVKPDAVLTIPGGKTLDASQEGNGLTWDSLSEYLSVGEDGKIVVEESGTLLLPPNPTQEQLNSLPITGEGTVKAGGDLVCMIRFDSQGGSEVQGYIALSGQAAEKPADPTKSGYIFGGWYKEAGCETPWSFESDTVTADLTLYAKWTPKPVDPPPAAKTYTVRFLDGGTELATLTVREGSKAAPPDEPVKEGYRFAGWHTDLEGTEAFDFETPITADLTLYAKWTALPGGEDVPSSGGSSDQDDDDDDEPRPPAATATTITQNPDGSTTKTTTDRRTGTVITVTTAPDGTSVTVVTDQNGHVVSTEASVPKGAAVLPAAPEGEVKITVKGGGKAEVTLPAESAGPGTVAVLVSPEGTKTVVRKSILTENGVVLTVQGSAVVRLENRGRTFPDVPEGWKAEAAAFVSAREILKGGTDGLFRPDAPMTRAMLAVALHNLEGNPFHGTAAAFLDVPEHVWYAEAVSWASARGIVTGYTDEIFGPGDCITREQLAVILWRTAGHPAPSSRVLPFPDVDQAADYAREALCWAVEHGIIHGGSGGTLAPKGLATRAQTAQMLKNFLENG